MSTQRSFNPLFFTLHIAALHLIIGWVLIFGGAPENPGTNEVLSAIQQETSGDTLDEATAQEAPAPVPFGARPGPLDPAKIYPDGDQMLADLGNDWRAELTLDTHLQAKAEKILNRSKVPFGAIVVMDVKDGDVLAMVDRYDERAENAPTLEEGGPSHLALRRIAPAASIFKIATAAALVESGVRPHREYPFKNARRRVYLNNLTANAKGLPRSSLTTGFAHSNNGLFSRLADKNLNAEDMEVIADRFGFNKVLPFPLLTDASTAHIPRNRLERARMSAGFWHTYLTPLHAASIAASIAGDGSIPTPRLVRRLHAPDDRTIEAPNRGAFTRAMRPDTALAMRDMMAATVKKGTGRRSFSKWPSKLRHIRVAGKTGTLAKREPYTSYTWFVGYAPADAPQVAIAVMVGNGALWWQRATDVARDTLAAHFTYRAERTVAAR